MSKWNAKGGEHTGSKFRITLPPCAISEKDSVLHHTGVGRSGLGEEGLNGGKEGPRGPPGLECAQSLTSLLVAHHLLDSALCIVSS